MFDVLVKRIHEYKRQHLKVLHIVSLYHGIKSNPALAVEPRTFIFGGKAAPGYHLAKLMIKLITAVGDVINRDPDVRDRLKVVFLPNFNVTNGQRVYPAADLSEQISTAGKEASGTGNMKFAMNGALTIGTLDGANIELRDEVGAENFFLFGLNAQEVVTLQAHGYRPADYYAANQSLREVIDLIRSGFFSRGDTELFRPLVDNLMYYDPYMVFADFQSYLDARPKRPRSIATASAGPECRFSTPRAAASFHPIGRSASTARKSGAPNRFPSPCSRMRKQEPHSAAQGFGGAPQQLIAHRECGQILPAHRQFAQPADRDGHGAADGRGRKLLDRCLALIGHDPHPGISGGDQLLDLAQREYRASA